MLTVGGLFSGIGGWELGLERAGLRILWHCESEPYPRRVLERHWPDIPCYPDVRELRGADVEPVDVICGGFPCQDISSAGLRAGIDGERSGLWSEMFRLVDELRPRYVLVENVSDLAIRGLDRVLGDLASIGFDAEWDCLRASDFGAPHQRARLWIVAYPNREGEHDGPVDAKVGRAPQFVGEPEGDGRRPGWTRRPDPAGTREPEPVGALRLADADGTRLEGHWRPELRTRERAARETGPVGGDIDGYANHWLVEPDVGRVAHGIPHRVDRLRALGNALVPQIAGWIGRRILDYEAEMTRLASDEEGKT